MKRARTDTFVLELPLVVTPLAERTLLGRFEVGRRLYNSVLGEALKRQRLKRESRAWQKARRLKDKKESSATFRKISSEHNFTSASLSAFGTTCKNEAGWNDRLGAHETQKIAERAFAAVEAFGFGTRGKPRFKGINRPPHSIESKTNASGIRWKAGFASIEWNDITLPALLAPAGKDDYQRESLCRPTKYCRIVWRVQDGKRRWYVQLMQEGLPPLRRAINHGKEVGLDIGPSTIAIAGEQVGELAAFCPTVKQPWQKVRQIQRAMDRSRRATNPECYNSDGTWKKGKRQSNILCWLPNP
jgi:putative transposase